MIFVKPLAKTADYLLGELGVSSGFIKLYNMRRCQGIARTQPCSSRDLAAQPSVIGADLSRQ